MKPWHLGNTTVRSPFRLRDGLIVLSTSSLQGNLRGQGQDIAFRQLLGDHNIVELGDDKTNSVGRKWRSALNKLGFLYPEISAETGIQQRDVGIVDTITPSGWRLIRSESVPAIQECFLRALAAHYIPSPLEPKFDCSVFSPLKHTLALMLEIDRQIQESCFNFIEIACIVQLTNYDDSISQIISRILEFRKQRGMSDNKRQFDQQALEKIANELDYKPQTFKDYADTNIRYLKATGLVQSKGRGISLVAEKKIFVNALIEDTAVPSSPSAYFNTLCEGAVLPTDNSTQPRSQ